MTRVLRVIVTALTVLFACNALGEVTGSRHDLSIEGNEKVSPCDYCHTPHLSESIKVQAEWDLAATYNGNSFTIYGMTATGDTIPDALGPNSLVCLGCHDGIIAENIEVWRKSDDWQLPWSANCITQRSLNGRDYVDEHPVGFRFREDPLAHGVPIDVFKPIFGIDSTGYGFELYGTSGIFECATCHDAHDDEIGLKPPPARIGFARERGASYFLRAPRATICTDCHQNK